MTSTSASSPLTVVSRLEESCLITGVYIMGPMVAGIAICLLFCLLWHLIRTPAISTTNANANAKTSTKHYAQIFSRLEYWFAILSILFSILLCVSYCVLGTDLLVPWNDDASIEDSYDATTMSRFTSFCIFLWYFSKLFFYLAFLYFAYCSLSLSHTYKLFLRIFMSAQVVATLVSVCELAYLNQDLQQIQITPTHQIQLIAQLKGHFFYEQHSNSITEIVSMLPLLTDVMCLMVMFKVCIQRSQQLQFEHEAASAAAAARQYIAVCVRAMMLLFVGSISTWALFLNVFLKSPVVWLLLPYDLLLNNLCLFLLFPHNQSLYLLLCFNCHQFTFFQCFFPNFKSSSADANNDASRFFAKHNQHNRTMQLLQIPSDSVFSRSQGNKKGSASPGASTQSGMVKQKPQPQVRRNVDVDQARPPPMIAALSGDAGAVTYAQQLHISNESYSDLRNLPQVPMAFGDRLNVDARQTAAMQFYHYNNHNGSSSHCGGGGANVVAAAHPSPSLLYAAAAADAASSQAHSPQPSQPMAQLHHHHMQTTTQSHVYDKRHLFPSGITKSQSTVTATKSDPSYLHDVNFNVLLQPTSNPPLSQSQTSQPHPSHNLQDLAPHSHITAAERHHQNNDSLSFSASNIIKAIVTGVGGKLQDEDEDEEEEDEDEDAYEEDACEHEPLNCRQNDTTIIHQGFVDHVFRISTRARDDDDDEDEEEEDEEEDETVAMSVSEENLRTRRGHCNTNLTMVHIVTGSALDEEDEDESQQLNHCEFDCSDSDSFAIDDEEDDDHDRKYVATAQNMKSVSSTMVSSSQTATRSTLNTRSNIKDNMSVPNFGR